MRVAAHEVGEVIGRDGAELVSVVEGVELRIGEAAAEGDGVFAHSPDRIRGRIESVLKNARVGSLELRGGPKFHAVGVGERDLAQGSAYTMLMPGKMFEPKVIDCAIRRGTPR